MGDKETGFDVSQRKRIAELERRVEMSEGQPAILKFVTKENKSRKRKERRSESGSSGETSRQKLKKSRVSTG